MLVNTAIKPFPQRLRSELQLGRFKLKHTRKEDFAIPIFTALPQFGLTLFRCLCSLYATAWLVLDALRQSSDTTGWFLNVSSLAMCCQVLFFVTGSMLAEVSLFHDLNKFTVLRRSWSESRGLSHSINTMETTLSVDVVSRHGISSCDSPSTSSSRQDDQRTRRYSRTFRVIDIGWYRTLFWLIYYVAVELTFITSVVSLLTKPRLVTDVHDLSGLITLHRNLILPLLLLVDVAINAIPIGLLHVVYPLTVASVYVVISLFHWRFGDERLRIAPELACVDMPCAKHISMTLLLGVPVAHSLLFIIHVVKLFIIQYTRHVTEREAKPMQVHRDFPVIHGPLAIIDRCSSV